MKQVMLALATALMPFTAFAENTVVARIVDDHILPRFERLAQTSEALKTTAMTDCTATSIPLRAAYADAFDAWVSASHLRFGPTEKNDRAFAIAFWPDSRGATPRSLSALIIAQDPIAALPDTYSQVSIAARGFYAMEFMLYDDPVNSAGSTAYRCTLIQTIAADTAAMTSAIRDDWVDSYAAKLLAPSGNGPYRSDEEVLQELLKALSTGLQFTSDTRLGRPLGTFDKPHPTRVEARRSGRSALHVALSLMALKELAVLLADKDSVLTDDLNAAFGKALTRLENLNDPVFAGVAEPQSRLKVEAVQQSVDTIRHIVRGRLGPKLGVAAGFNALDGD
ncbi:MAG: imelysin family protein [Sulfitobacter sp.]